LIVCFSTEDESVLLPRRTAVKSGAGLAVTILAPGCMGDQSGSTGGQSGNGTSEPSTSDGGGSSETSTSSQTALTTETDSAQGSGTSYSDPTQGKHEDKVEGFYDENGYEWVEWESLEGISLPDNMAEIAESVGRDLLSIF